MVFNEFRMEDLDIIKKDNKEFLGMNEGQKKYHSLYTLYRKWLSEYIINTLNLKKYDYYTT